jgi:hypothetical protein
MRRLAPAALAALAIAVPVASAQAADYTLRAKGSSKAPGHVTGVGAFKPQSDASLDAAKAAFGTPSSQREQGSKCSVAWSAIGLQIAFVNFSTGGACEFGKAQTVLASGRVWRTSRGLHIADSVRRLRHLYPHAARKGKAYRLVGGASFFGDGPRPYSVIAARTDGRKVKAFKLFVGAAGE